MLVSLILFREIGLRMFERWILLRVLILGHPTFLSVENEYSIPAPRLPLPKSSVDPKASRAETLNDAGSGNRIGVTRGENLAAWNQHHPESYP
jgi:hypothetical protein